MPPSGAPVEPAWAPSVHAEESSDLAAELEARLPPRGAPRSISVTELLGARRAFWRAQGPPLPPPPPERAARMEEGRRLHTILGQVLGRLGALEVRVRGPGVHGRIDLLTDRPVEVKTTASELPRDDLLRSRPDHLDQLGLYCLLLGRSDGRLLYFRSGGDGATSGAAWDVAFRDLDGMRRAMLDRAEALRGALASGDPGSLPRCAWYGRGCELQTSGRCQCTGTEPGAPPLVDGHLDPVLPRPEVAESLAAAIARAPVGGPPSIDRFRDLLYPRQAFFRRTVRPTAPAATEPPAVPGEGSDLYRRANEALEAGPVGAVTRLPTQSEEPDEEVGGWDGVPYLLRTSRLRTRREAAAWVAAAPQYALELGFRAVATGTGTARLIVGYESLPETARRIQVVTFTFRPVTPFSRVWRARVEALAQAVRLDDPGSLPPCPAWMAARCDYRDVCGCGSPSGRVQWKRTVDAVRTNPSDS